MNDNDLTINKLHLTSMGRAKRWHGKNGEWNALEWAGAMCGEAGEAANAAKKLRRLEGNLQTINEEARHYATLEEARIAVANECADTILYALLLMGHVGITDAETVIASIFNKKSVEYGFPERV